MRAIARDMGRLLGCRGHIIALRRSQVGGGFHEGDAVSVEELEGRRAAGWDQLEMLLSPIETALREPA